MGTVLPWCSGRRACAQSKAKQSKAKQLLFKSIPVRPCLLARCEVESHGKTNALRRGFKARDSMSTHTSKGKHVENCFLSDGKSGEDKKGKGKSQEDWPSFVQRLVGRLGV